VELRTPDQWEDEHKQSSTKYMRKTLKALHALALGLKLCDESGTVMTEDSVNEFGKAALSDLLAQHDVLLEREASGPNLLHLPQTLVCKAQPPDFGWPLGRW
jgi:hypothetical protein